MKTRTLAPLFVLELAGGEPYICSILNLTPIIPLFTDYEFADTYRRSHIPNAAIKKLANLLMVAGYVGAISGHPEVVLRCNLVLDPIDDGFDGNVKLDASELLEGLTREHSER